MQPSKSPFSHCAPLDPVFFFLRAIGPNHPLTGNLVCSGHMVCLSICWLPSSLSSAPLPFSLFAPLLLFVHLSPLHFLLPPVHSALLPPPSINSCVSSLSAISYPEGSVLHVTESACFDRQGPNLASHPVATVPSATPPPQHQPSTNTHRDRKIREAATEKHINIQCSLQHLTALACYSGLFFFQVWASATLKALLAGFSCTSDVLRLLASKFSCSFFVTSFLFLSHALIPESAVLTF